MGPPTGKPLLFGTKRSTEDSGAYGTDYVIDGLYVTSAEFDRIMRLEGIP